MTLMRRLSLMISVVGLVPLAITGPAAAQQSCQGRPGASAIEQYCEAIPDGTGSRQTPGDKASSSDKTSQVPTGSRGDLQSSGPDGEAVLALVAASGGSGGGGGNSGAGGTSGGSGGSGKSGTASGGSGVGKVKGAAAVQPAVSPSDNPLRAVKSAVSSGATVGSGFVWGLVALTLLALVVGWIGFRQRHTTS